MFTVFVVDSYRDEDGCFAIEPGKQGEYGFAYLGGPYKEKS